jgi:4-amino-4-deoxy-L-arabinose transferase-like glycosyltransferase
MVTWDVGMSSKYSVYVWVCFLLAVVYATVSVLTVSVYQVPWFDGVYYADVAWSFLTQGNFSALIDYPRNTNGFFHVPLFSIIQGGMFKLFGLGVWQVRILPLLSGLTIFLILSTLVFKVTRTAKYTLLFMLLFISDRAINFSLHSGRMDMVALLFVLLSILFFERTLKWQEKFWATVGAVLAGLLLAVGFLTALRVAVATIPCVFLFFLYKPDRRGTYYYRLIIYGVMAALPVMAWLWYAYGGVSDAYSTASHLDGFSGHFGILASIIGNIFRRTYEIPKMLLFYSTIIYLFCRHREQVRQNFFFCMYFLITLGFILFVIERGPYRAVFFPFVYFSIIIGIYLCRNCTLKRVGQLALTAVLAINVILSMPRIIYLWMNWSVIQDANVAEQIYKEIPPGSRVIADYRFYYMLRKNNCEILIPRGTSANSVEYAENGFRAQYVLGQPVLLPQLSERMELITTVGRPAVPMNSILKKFVYLEPLMVENHFNAQLWKVKE